MYLYDFMAWNDWEQKEPSKKLKYYLFMGGFLKKKRPYLIKYYRYNINEEPEKYYYFIVAAFRTMERL